MPVHTHAACAPACVHTDAQRTHTLGNSHTGKCGNGPPAYAKGSGSCSCYLYARSRRRLLAEEETEQTGESWTEKLDETAGGKPKMEQVYAGCNCAVTVQ